MACGDMGAEHHNFHEKHFTIYNLNIMLYIGSDGGNSNGDGKENKRQETTAMQSE